MLNPLNQLTSQIKSKYLIATRLQRKERVKNDEQPETELLSEYHSLKPVGRALEEIADVKFTMLFQVIIMVKNSFDH